MPCYDWRCPECGYEWGANCQLVCGACLMEKDKKVIGVRVAPPMPPSKPKPYEGES